MESQIAAGAVKDKGMTQENATTNAWAPPIIWAVVICFFSVFPTGNLEMISIGYADKVAHFLLYFILGALMIKAYGRIEGLTFRKSLSFTLILGGVYGILLELVQIPVPGRNAEVYDVAANIIGIVSGIILGRILLWQK